MRLGTASKTKGHPWYAALYDPMNRLGERRMMEPLRLQYAGAAKGRVLEIGPATGANFPYYQAVTQLVATDPDPFMLRRARKRAWALRLAVKVPQCAGEALPFADAAFDTVVATLVFCSVADQARAPAEVRRVLQPGGTFRFIEYVRAQDDRVARWQDRLTPIWRRCGAGGHLNRSTVEAIAASGFRIVATQPPSAPLPLLPFVGGVAVPA